MPPWFVATIAPMAFAGLMVHPLTWIMWWAFLACLAWADSEDGL